MVRLRLSKLLSVTSSINSTDFPTGHFKTVFFVIGKADVAKLLISKGANIEVRNFLTKTPLHYAAYQGNFWIISHAERKTSQKVPFDSWCCCNVPTTNVIKCQKWHSKVFSSLTFFFITSGSTDVARVLIEHGSNVDSRIYCGDTPLSLAASNGNSIWILNIKNIE